ncbi:energy-coupling factor ABC transporter ATP-binding protein [Leptolinea tardivitalis]|uniref:energy-coupling factor ABC transporter ATP-binding protein n=1 Tax=Leptolinea tardivitalis TaxID=229920 RepID=UPI000A86F120|nr:ABC transporter ATP-binding protein [Leptolinea tardivitalis]GAP20260.1 ABC-type cobalt transport system, ATPase component [Leptolinea tardivitalis]
MEPLIKIQQLSFSYPDGKNALTDINLSVYPGEKIGIVGANGAGKSTLLMHINGIFTGEGSVIIDGMECDRKHLEKIRARVGVVFQNPDDQLFSITVYDDVAYGPRYQGLPKEEIHSRVEKALAAVQMEGYADRNPYHLSGGEKKRIAIATVLSMNPDILVFDEPTAGLDPRARRELLELLGRLPQTLLIATHDLELVDQLTTRMIVMNAGKIVADGPGKELLQDQQLLFNNGLI